MKFNIQDVKTAEVVMRGLTEDNVYIRTYGALVKGYKHPAELQVGEVTRMTYSLSGQKATTYVIVRTE